MNKGFRFDITIAEEMEVAFGGNTSLLKEDEEISLSSIINQVLLCEDSIGSMWFSDLENAINLCEILLKTEENEVVADLLRKLTNEMDLREQQAEAEFEAENELMNFRKEILESAKNGTLTCSMLDVYSDWSKDIYGFRDRTLNYLYAEAIKDRG